MTLFVDVPTLGEMVRKVGTSEFISGLMNCLEQDFLRWEDFDKSARTAAHSDTGVIELMPVADAENYAFKYVNGHPSNPLQSFSTVMAFGALSDVTTGYPRLLSELTLSTALRTAATSAMAAKALARKDSHIMGMIGCGAQSEFQAIAFHTIAGIDDLRIFDIDKAAMGKVEKNLLNRFPNLKVTKTKSAHDCVRSVDIVTTVTADKTWATILTSDMIQPGMHINAVGGDCPGKTELDINVLKAGKIFIEHEPQSRVEGEIQQLPADHLVYPLWRVIAELDVGRESDQQITIFDSVGFALEDFSSLRYIFSLATHYNLGEVISLVPRLDNPKDLFELILYPFDKPNSRKVA
ncbi:MAG: ornithine cyclodeaminase [Gammaproteobacteria bacterium]|jgi:ornithine cyclodeaminase